MTQRTDRIDQLLREEIGAILAREISDPRIGFATITDVETTPDLRHAKVWVSVIGPAAERDETVATLQHAMGYVQRELGHRLRLKRIPALHVRLDDTAEKSTRVLTLLAGIDDGLVAEDLPGGETLPTPVARIRHGDDAVDGDEAAADDGAGAGGEAGVGEKPGEGTAAARSRGRSRRDGPRTGGPRTGGPRKGGPRPDGPRKGGAPRSGARHGSRRDRGGPR